ncbi:MAG: Ppx/GppA phosphatase family protein [Gemmatimonadota bacterium]|nr:Ppx/GppA phosphatase family protein [Gemmatimonadota bacterium]
MRGSGSATTGSVATRPAPGDRIAAIDVGSNSIRLVVAEYDPEQGLTIIDEVRDQARLATGLASTGMLDEATMDRAIEGLQRMKEVVTRRGARQLTAVATSAVREAGNGAAFVARVRKEAGIPLRIIDGETEAALSWRSVAHHFPLTKTRALVADIGGGSLELIGAVNGLIETTASLPLGAVRMTERFPIDERGAVRAVRAIRKAARKKLKRAATWRAWSGAVVIGSGGTFTNLARMALERRGQVSTDAVHGEVVTAAEVEQLLEWLATRTLEERRNVPGLNPERADIILAGLAVTAELLDLAAAPAVRVSGFGLREGLLLEMVGGTTGPVADPLRPLREFVERCQGDRRHVEQVRTLALSLYDQLGEGLGCGADERFLLEAAALLHDVGQMVSYRQHHKHSYQLILHADRLNLSARDRSLVALISRYHRKRGPSRKHDEYMAMPEEERAVVRRLSGLLRVADGLDRGHTSIVEKVRTRLMEHRLSVRVVPRLAGADVSLECWGAERKADVLAALLERDVTVAPATI